jgi:type I restriction enzyme, S subunit
MMSTKIKFNSTDIGLIPEDWTVKELQDVTLYITDGKHGDCENKSDSGYYFLSVKDVIDGKLDYSEARQIMKEDFIETHKRTRLDLGDVLLTNSGTIGRLAIAEDLEKTKKTTFQKSVAILKPNKEILDTYFLYYYLLANTSRIIEQGRGTTQHNLLLKDLRSFKIAFPSLKTQKNIISSLRTIDEKITLNHQMNKTLDDIGESIFKHWFIDFEFPNKNGKPYRSSDGELVFNTTFSKDIPETWTISNIGDELKITLGGTPSTTNKSFWKNGTEAWINSGKINEFRITEPTTYITKEAIRNSATKLLPKSTTVLAITGATLGQISRLEIDTCANQSVIGIIESDHIPSEYVYYWIRYTIDEIIRYQTGGAQQHINKNNVENSKILIPSEKIIQEYKKIIQPLFEKISLLCFEINKLIQLRNSLLSKLLFGQMKFQEEV